MIFKPIDNDILHTFEQKTNQQAHKECYEITIETVPKWRHLVNAQTIVFPKDQRSSIRIKHEMCSNRRRGIKTPNKSMLSIIMAKKC